MACPGSAELGEREMIAGPELPVRTVNPLLNVTISEPVDSVTFRAPKAAAGSISNTAEALVGEFTASKATVIPEPKLAAVVPAAKCVNCPVIPTSRFCCPCCPEFGLSSVRRGVPAATVKLFESEAASVPVVKVTVCTSGTAAVLILTIAVAVVAELTVSESTLIPAPNEAVVVPCKKCVDCPVIATDRFCWPC